MARYGQAFKDRAVARLLPPQSASVETVSRELGISTATLERWQADARFEAVLATAAMDEASKSAWCREHDVYPQELEQWRGAATQALADPEDGARTRHREDKALAETAALLVLSKKLEAIFPKDKDEDA